jgi:hypothetical protein
MLMPVIEHLAYHKAYDILSAVSGVVAEFRFVSGI